MENMTSDLRALLAQATPGEWTATHCEYGCSRAGSCCPYGKEDTDRACLKCDDVEIYSGAMVDQTKTVEYGDYIDMNDADADFIAAAHNLLPAILAQLDALKAQLANSVVLPCAIGTPIWYIRKNHCKHADISSGYCNAKMWYAQKGVKKESGCKDCPHCVRIDVILETKFRLALLDEKRVGHLHFSECFLTRPAAEAAMKGEKQ